MADERVQRRLAAILATDVVGYSRMMEADEEGTRARLSSLHAEPIPGSQLSRTNSTSPSGLMKSRVTPTMSLFDFLFIFPFIKSNLLSVVASLFDSMGSETLRCCRELGRREGQRVERLLHCAGPRAR